MKYKTCSVKEVIARINRTTRDKDASLYGDILEWIPEGINKLKTRYSVVLDTDKLKVKDHLARLPCGLVSIEAVFYNGYRLSNSNRVESKRLKPEEIQTVFKTSIDLHSTSDLLPGEPYSYSSEYYKLQLDYLHTSFEEGELDLLYWKMPVDKEGYPLIVDNENYKEALYWYVMMKLIEAGYEHKVFDWRHCWEMWENVYLPRAIAEMKMPTGDDMDRLRKGWTRLILPLGYEDNFDIGNQFRIEQ